MEERGLDSLQPGRALIDQRLASAPLSHVRRRGPGLWRSALAEQRPQPAGVLAVGLRAPLLAPQRARLDRLGGMRHHTTLTQRLADEQPARARLDRDVDLLASEPSRPRPNSLRRGNYRATAHVARPLVESVESDLRPMHIKPGYDHIKHGYDRHQGPPLAPALPLRASLSRRGEGPGSCHLCASVVAQ